ncbi:MAG: CapA family protein, partial [Actinobacteria bacterium]|nr:CapA family protein [Actinomycetota bacterium]
MPDRGAERVLAGLVMTAVLLAGVTMVYAQVHGVSPGGASMPEPSPESMDLVLAPVVETSVEPSPAPQPEPVLSSTPSPAPPPPVPRSAPAASDEQLAGYAAELPPDVIEIASVGDVNMGGTLGEVIQRQGAGYPWERVAPLLQSADIAFANFESTASVRGSPAAKQFTFRSDPASLGPMGLAGIDVASLANNHSLDYGPEALLDTVANLRQFGMQPVGAGANESESWRPAIVEAGGLRFAFIAASRVLPAGWAATADSAGVASAYQGQRLLGEVAAAKASGAVVIVSVHWGVEGSTSPEPYQVELAHALVDAGASVVLGHHPHVVQPVVRYRGAVIAYSLGNFVFTA